MCRKLAHGIVAGVLAWVSVAYAANDATCSVNEVREFSNRVHVRCIENYSLPGQAGHPLKYFVASKNTSLAAQLGALGSLAQQPGSSRLIVNYEPYDLSGAGYGCQASDCRRILGARLEARGKRVELTLPNIDGEARTAVVYPTIDPKAPAPVVFFFHGNTGSAADSISKLELHNHWPEATIVYAEGTAVTAAGLPTTDTASFRGWTLRFPYKLALGQRKDQKYVLALLAKLNENGGDAHIDTKRIYAAGGSSGGFFTFSLSDLMPDVFRGFAVIGAYTRFKVYLEAMGCPGSNPFFNLHARPLVLATPVDRAHVARPVLYLFGNGDTTFDNEGYFRGTGCGSGDVIMPTGWNSDFRLASHAADTLRQLFVRNHARPPLVGNGSPTWWTTQGTTPYTADPLDDRGALVAWNVYAGGHFHPDAGKWMVGFFKGLPEE